MSAEPVRMSCTRRTLLRRALGSIALLGLPAGMQPAIAQIALAVKPVRGNVAVIDAGSSNVVACTTDDGLVLVDSGAPEFADTLMTTLAGLSDKGVHTLFNTHWHDDACGANELIGARGAAIVAHSKTWQHLSTEYYLPHEERYKKPLAAAGLPTFRFQDKGSVQVRGATIDYGALVQAHTDGDIYVYFREANVLAAGGAVSPDADPELDWYGGGWLGGRVDSLKRLVALANDDTLIVPAHGRVMSKADLVAELDMTQEVYNRLLKLIRSGCSAACMEQEGALAGLSHSWQDPQRFLYAAYKGMWAHHYNLAADIL